MTMASGTGGGGADRVLHRAVVEEVIYDPRTFDFSSPYFYTNLEEGAEPEEGQKADRIHFSQLLKDVPPMTLLVRLLTDGDYKNSGKLRICYPLFPPHFQMPIKVSEQVWVMCDRLVANDQVMYWLARVPENIIVDDVNFTHGDRKHTTMSDHPDTLEEHDGTITIPGFPDGADGDTQTFSMMEGYDGFYFHAMTRGDTKEPVPHFIKRPGDLVLQGSNNTLISLGQDRGWRRSDTIAFGDEIPSNANWQQEGFDPTSEDPDLIPPGAGTIDMVTGRGQYVSATPTDENAVQSDFPFRTAPLTILNDRVYIETDKNLTRNGFEAKHLTEGDPDFAYDASRVYISSRTAGDFNFELDFPDPATPGGELAATDQEEVFDSYIVAKSNEIRIVARQLTTDVGYEDLSGYQATITEEGEPYPLQSDSSRSTAQEGFGSIRLIKEGVPDDEGGKGRATIMMMPDGTIMIDGPIIVIGSGIEKDNGAGTQVVLGRGAVEPLVLGTQLATAARAWATAVEAYYDAMALEWPKTLGNMGGPLPTAAAHVTAASDLKDAAAAFAEAVEGVCQSKLAKTL